MSITDDFYGKRGCCLTCDEADKETMEGLQRNPNEEHDCLCYECKCSRCSWLYYHECQRKDFEQINQPHELIFPSDW